MAKRLVAQKPFDFSARVTLQLGRESISSSTVAISELLKNSYDADAETVDLDFHLRSDQAVSTLIIRDDGIGMDLNTLSDYWLRIGTDYKAINNSSSKKGRKHTGAKGLGRLGIDRLCKKLILFTKKEGEKTATQLIVDWRSFEGTSKSLSEIQHKIYDLDLPLNDKYGDIFSSESEHGTYLALIGLKDDWQENFIDDLANELRLLISPYRGINDFSVQLSTSKNGQVNSRTISSTEILATAHWKVSSQVLENGNVKAKFENKVSGETISLAPVPWNKWIKNEGELPLFGPLDFEFHYIPRDLETLKKLKLVSSDWKRFMDQNRGVRIYRDDFRVRPYGEPSGKGDWLDLGYRKSSNPSAISQGNWSIGPHQIVGAINISREHNAVLDDQANREGIVENNAFFQMRTYVLKVIESFESLIHKDAVRDDDTDLSEELKSLLVETEEDEQSALEDLKSTFTKRKKSRKKHIPPAKLLAQRIKEFERAKAKREQALDEYYEALKKEKKKLEDDKDTLSNLATLGILTVSFGHEIRTHSSLALGYSNEILAAIQSAQNDDSKLDKNDLEKITRSVKDSINYVNNFSKLAINNIRPDKRNRRKINVPEVFQYIFELMQKTLEQMKVEHTIEYVKIAPEDFNVRSYEIDWESIAINFITNSLWAVENVTGRKRLIKVTFERIGGTKLQVKFEDSGRGLEEGSEEAIFLPMNSSRRDRAGNAIGTGMGLAIIRTHVIDHMNGYITACNSEVLEGACFKIEVLQDT